MDVSKYMAFVPFEVGDIVTMEGYGTDYKLIDILTIHSVKDFLENGKDSTKAVQVYFKVQDMLNEDVVMTLNYTDYNWKMVKSNETS